MKNDIHDLGLVLDSRVRLVIIESWQEPRVLETIGSLAPGMAGDAAVFDLREGRFVWHDMAGHNVEGKVRLDTFLTVRAGQVVWREGRLLQMGEC